jgi:hypothetical protein
MEDHSYETAHNTDLGTDPAADVASARSSKRRAVVNWEACTVSEFGR